MSLLLDALKKAAQEKLDRQHGEPQDGAGGQDSQSESTQYDAGETARTERAAGAGERTEYAADDDATKTAARTQPGRQTDALGRTRVTDYDVTRSDPTRSDHTQPPGEHAGTELELEPMDRDASEPGLDTTGFDAGVTVDEPGHGVTTDELDAYLADDTGTDRPRADDDTRFGAEAERTGSTYSHSMTENLHMERAGYQAYGSPGQAADVFAGKSPPAGNRTRLVALIGLAVVAALVLVGLFGYGYLAEMNQDDMMYSRPRPRPADQSLAQTAPAASDTAQQPAEDEVDPALLIEQEDYSELFKDTVAKYESESTQDRGGDRGRAPDPATGRQKSAPQPARTSAPANRRTVAGRPGEFSIQRGGSAGGEPLQAVLMRGWRAYNEGDLEAAEVAYQQALNRSSRNRDALLGLAAIHQARGETALARQRYRRLLELDPRDDLALAGLTSLAGRDAGGQPAQNEAPGEISRIKTLLSERPAAPHLHFTLGNLFAARQRWPEAQQAYFDAYRLADENPDYTFNLAVSLEHLGKPEAAVRFYREALQFARNRRANFEPAALQNRINTLTGDHAASQTKR